VEQVKHHSDPQPVVVASDNHLRLVDLEVQHLHHLDKLQLVAGVLEVIVRFIFYYHTFLLLINYSN
jgi:hypothetical protein